MKIKIINKKKFVRTLIAMVGLLLALLLGLNNTYSKTEISYKEEFIYAGDTLWSIAEKQEKDNRYYENKDIRSIVSELKDINHIDGNLKIGEKILIPTFNY
ncbi:MAG: LysM peptidoglycan-binding domain-containing protein [Clostridia bacterium]